MDNFTNLLTEKSIVQQDQSGTGGYNYYALMNQKGAYVILREDVAQTEYRYFVSSVNFDTNWTNRASLTYEKPSGFPRA